MCQEIRAKSGVTFCEESWYKFPYSSGNLSITKLQQLSPAARQVVSLTR
jgi:hypothetical protein